jgi:hypothetical protein
MIKLPLAGGSRHVSPFWSKLDRTGLVGQTERPHTLRHSLPLSLTFYLSRDCEAIKSHMLLSPTTTAFARHCRHAHTQLMRLSMLYRPTLIFIPLSYSSSYILGLF